MDFPESANFEFKADWRYVCNDVGTNDAEIIQGRLDKAHDHVLKCFRDSVTEITWQLFQPEEDR